jgi:hypothetical protein
MRKLNPFKPTDIAGCQLWLDSTDSSTVSFSSGSNVSQWRDKSGSSNHFSITNGTTSYISDNGMSVISFPSGAIMSSANQITFTTSSAFYIVSRINSITGAGIGMLLGFTNINGADKSIRLYVSGTIGISLLGTAGVGDGNELANNNYFVNGSFNPSFGSNVYLNVYSIIGTVAPQSGGTSFLTFSSSFLSRFFIGNIAEFIYYPAGITNRQRLQIEGYLAQKWGLQASLPAGNPGRTGVIYPRNLLIDSLTTGQPTRKPFIRSRATLNYIGFTITGSTAASATNYQIPITVFRSIGTNTGSSVYLGTEIYSDYSNLYFLASNQVTALPFYIESGTQTTASARIWVSVPSIPASPSTTKVYIYWNTTGTYTTPSNGTTTFPSLFDDFNGTAGSAPNASKWSVQLRGTSTSSSVQLNGSGEVILTPTDNSISSVSLLSLNTMPANGFSIYIRRKYTTGVYTDTSFATTNTLVASDNSLTSDWWHPTLGGGYMLLYQNTGLVIVRRQPTFTGSSQAPTDLIIPPISTLINTYEIVEIQYSTAGVINFIWNGVNKGTITDTTFLSGGKYVLISQGNYSGISNNVETVDYVFVRSYLNPEPSVTAWGSINTP